MSTYVLGFQDIDQTLLSLVGGKGASLGELARLDGVSVPDGFCVSTDAFKRVLADAPSMGELLDRLSLLEAGNRDAIRECSGELRRVIEAIAIPDDVVRAIVGHLARLGAGGAYAVRSSATAEDLPTASFAGQQDTYLNVTGQQAILEHVSKCWASLFTERAVTYRIRNGFDHRKVRLAVVIQQMVQPRAAGVLFTADPLTSNRKVSAIDSGFGLGEALVAGLVNADGYKVRDGQIIDKQPATKQPADFALTDEQILRLERLGRRLEAHFGRPQDIEWCLADDAFHIVQSRPITTLFPIPEAHDGKNHVYVSVGHGQMMTDPLKPLGLSLFQLTAMRPMDAAGGRLFVDFTNLLASPGSREAILAASGKSDPLVGDALTTLLERGDFIEPQPATSNRVLPPAASKAQLEAEPTLVADLIESNRASIAELASNIQTKSGTALLDFILEDIPQLKQHLSDPRSSGVFMAALDAWSWLNENLQTWLGEKNAADKLSQSVPNNVTSEMGLALLDVSDVIRAYPDVIDYLHRVKDESFLDGLLAFAGGRQARDAIEAFLDRYGMRCVGEIDITRTRWREQPAILVPLILGNIKQFAPNASHQRFEQGRQEALEKERTLLEQLKQLPDGDRKAAETKDKIDVLRTFIGYREYPKYGMISRYFVYKQALLKEAERLVQANVIREREDIYYLTFNELRHVVGTHALADRLIRARKDEHALNEQLIPPRVITSEGEIITGRYKRENIPAEALVGLAVSAGVVEGRARVLSNLEGAELEDGDILVTTFTDPSWTPLFVSIKGLVTEVGGLMTHGAVIAREYGLPAVVGVENATRLIQDGQRIRVHGTEGYVELLSS